MTLNGIEWEYHRTIKHDSSGNPRTKWLNGCLAGENRANGGFCSQPSLITGRITISVGFYTVLSFWGLRGIEPGGYIPSYRFFDSQLFIFRWLGNQEKDCQNLDSLGS